jgi:hypothetical protein
MEMLLGTCGVKLLELARHYPSVAFCIALAVFAAIDWLINPEGSPGDAGVGGFFDDGDGELRRIARKPPVRRLA